MSPYFFHHWVIPTFLEIKKKILMCFIFKHHGDAVWPVCSSLRLAPITINSLQAMLNLRPSLCLIELVYYHNKLNEIWGAKTISIKIWGPWPPAPLVSPPICSENQHFTQTSENPHSRQDYSLHRTRCTFLACCRWYWVFVYMHARNPCSWTVGRCSLWIMWKGPENHTLTPKL